MNKLAAARKQLRNVLASLYKDSRSIQRIIDDAGMSDCRIDMSGSSVDIWHEVLKEAEKHNKIESIIEVVKSEYSNYSLFVGAADSYKTASSSTGAAVTNEQSNEIEYRLGVGIPTQSAPTGPTRFSQIEKNSWQLMISKWGIELLRSRTVQSVILLLFLAIVSLPAFLLDMRIKEWLFNLKPTPTVQHDTPTPTVQATVIPTLTVTPMPTSTPTVAGGVTVDFDCAGVSELAQVECEALVALYNSTDGPNWITNTNWLETNTPCTWSGITCTDNSVTEIRLPQNQLIGSIPVELSTLSNLRVLSLYDNQLRGSIPLELGSLNNLDLLALQTNQLDGNIPLELSKLSSLKELHLSQNNLTGGIPTELGNLQSLRQLKLGHNPTLSGRIPSELGNLTQLQLLELTDTNLNGGIPPTFEQLDKLEGLSLQNNHLSGSIPEELGQLVQLQCLQLDNNQLTGKIPASLSQLVSLEVQGACKFGGDGLALGNNMLNAVDLNLLDFLAQKDPDWAQTQRYDLVGHWQFDECTGSVVNDTSGLENHGNQQEAVIFTDDAVSGCALQFPVVGGLVTIAHSPALEPMVGTIIAWVKVDTLPTPDVAILGKMTDLHINRGIEGEGTVYDLRITTKGEVVGVVMNDDVEVSGEWSFVSSQPNSITPAIWHQIVFRWDDNTLSVFVDGQTKPEWTKAYKSIPNIGLSYHGRSPLILGAYSNNNLGNFDGKLDEVSFYARALSDEEIQRDYQLYIGSITTPPATVVPTLEPTPTATVPLTLPVNGESLPFCVTVSEISSTECEALVALYNSTDGPNWITKTNWLETDTPCTWYGISCTKEHVTGIILANNRLGGSIPAELGNLADLAALDLNSNRLTGSIPNSLGELKNLYLLYLHNNELMGSIPPELSNLIRLQQLYLQNNQLSASIPADLGKLSNLQILLLAHNQLTGVIPAELGNLPNLGGLDLGENELTGAIPVSFGRLNNLSGLLLNHNQLSGPIPPELGNLNPDKLQMLWLHNNQLAGAIPSELGNLKALGQLYLLNNQLSGPIPLSLTNLTRLKILLLDNNQLTATDPTLRAFLDQKAPNWEKTQKASVPN